MEVTRAASVAAAEDMLRRELAAMDRACSRFRADAEITLLHEQPGTWVPVSALLFEALQVAREMARWTGGAVDPTIGRRCARSATTATSRRSATGGRPWSARTACRGGGPWSSTPPPTRRSWLPGCCSTWARRPRPWPPTAPLVPSPRSGPASS
ncbi:MAG: FAD:protein FMN transferase [Acidimicrobiales bacterium]